MTIKCPLCDSADNRLLEVLSGGLLRRLYRRQLGINLGGWSPSTIELRHCHRCDLKFFVPGTTGDEKFYECLQKFDWYYLAEKQEYDVAAKHISSNDSVLEIGVGRGAFAGKIRPRSYVGLELSEAAVRMARQHGLNVYKDSIEQHSRNHSDSYDVVCSFQVLEHVAEPKRFIEFSLRCLKRGGKFIQSVPSEDAFLGTEANNILNMPPHHVTRWTNKALGSLAEQFSLEIVEIWNDKLSDFHLRPYSVAVIQNSLNTIFRRQQRCLDSKLALLPVKAAVRCLALVLEHQLKSGPSRPAGHSVTVVYRKL